MTDLSLNQNAKKYTQLETVNKNLEAYYDAWDKFIKAWIVIKINDPSCVYQWRLQAEIAMREAAYKAYLPTLYAEGPNGSDPKHLLVIVIDEGRNPLPASRIDRRSTKSTTMFRCDKPHVNGYSLVYDSIPCKCFPI
nr:isoform 2 of d-glycerate 3-kinase, chloroplastic [Quercus suber]